MPKKFTSSTQKTGELGENVATRFLMKHNFEILERNYTKKWGEVDIIAQKNNIVHFVEVKSVIRENLQGLNSHFDDPRPEDNMHPWKLKRLSRTIQTYLAGKNVSDETEWQADLLVVYLDIINKKSRIKVVNDIIL